MFELKDIFELAIRNNYTNHTFSRTIATFHHNVKQTILTCEQGKDGIYMAFIDKSGYVFRSEFVNSISNANLLMEL